MERSTGEHPRYPWWPQVLRCTRNWLHYGIPAAVLLCALVGAVRSLLGR